MEKTIEAINFNASEELIFSVEKVIERLDTFNDQIVKVDVYLESLSQTDEQLKKAKAKIFLPGHSLYAEEEARDFISASQGLYDKLKRQLRNQKEKDKANRNPRPDKP